MHRSRLRASSRVCRLRSQRFVETVPVLEVRLKPNSDPGLAWAGRSTPKSHESGSAPKSQWRATCVSRAVFHSPFSFRVISEAPSGSQLVQISGSGTRTGVQWPTVGFPTRVRFRTLAFFHPVVSVRNTPFRRFLRTSGRNCLRFFLWSHRDPACFDLESCQELWGPRAPSLRSRQSPRAHKACPRSYWDRFDIILKRWSYV